MNELGYKGIALPIENITNTKCIVCNDRLTDWETSGYCIICEPEEMEN